MSKKAYFARSIDFYDTPIDNRQIEVLGELGFEVVDPKDIFDKEEYDKDGMNIFFNEIKKCDVLVFRANKDEKITAGVRKEIHCAWDHNIPTLEFPSTIWTRSLNVEETRKYLEKVGER